MPDADGAASPDGDETLRAQERPTVPLPDAVAAPSTAPEPSAPASAGEPAAFHAAEAPPPPVAAAAAPVAPVGTTPVAPAPARRQRIAGWAGRRWVQLVGVGLVGMMLGAVLGAGTFPVAGWEGHHGRGGRGDDRGNQRFYQQDRPGQDDRRPGNR